MSEHCERRTGPVVGGRSRATGSRSPESPLFERRAGLRGPTALGGATVLAQIPRETVHALGIAPGRPVHAIIEAVAFDRSTHGPGIGCPPGAGSDVVNV